VKEFLCEAKGMQLQQALSAEEIMVPYARDKPAKQATR
jgi:hypothetical protein